MLETRPLAEPFLPVAEEAWRRLVEGALDGRPLESLRSATRDGVPVEPIHPAARQAEPIGGRPPGAPWRIVQRLDHPDPQWASEQALREAERGATGLALVPEGAPAADGFGIARSRDWLALALRDVGLSGLHLRLEPHSEGAESARALAGLVAEWGIEPAAADVAFGLDPAAVLAGSGGLPQGWEATAAELGKTARDLAARGFAGPILEADGRVYAAAGASEAQELALVLASAAEHLRALDRAGLPPDRALPLIGATLTVDADLFLSVAKLRAVRLLWARLHEPCGAPPAPLRLHAETARLMMMRADPHANLLRTTLAAFAAGAGGADSVTVLPFTIALGLPDSFARRLARNIQHLLIDESHVHRLADGAAGSGAAEALTDALCERAWAVFQEIEGEGGLVAGLLAGRVQARVANARGELLAAYKEGRAHLVGVTAYPDPEPAPVKVAELAPRRAPPDWQPALWCEPLAPFDLEAEVTIVPEGAP